MLQMIDAEAGRRSTTSERREEPEEEVGRLERTCSQCSADL